VMLSLLPAMKLIHLPPETYRVSLLRLHSTGIVAFESASDSREGKTNLSAKLPMGIWGKATSNK